MSNSSGSEGEPSDDSETKAIVKKLEPLLRPEVREQGRQILTMMVAKSHSGPLPAPEDFEHYERVLPGLGDRIVRLTEKEQGHRHKQEGRLILFDYGVRLLGQIGAVASLALLLACVAYCAYIGQPLAAGVIAAVGAIVIAFLQYSAQRLDREESEPAKPQPKQNRRKKR